MNLKTLGRKQTLSLNIDSIAELIAKTQLASGEIPWSLNDKTDPWDHVESIIGLTIGGYIKEARLGFEWMIHNQLDNGAWYASYKKGVPEDKTMDANLSSYISVGVFHHFLITKDISFLEYMWPTITSAIEYTVSLQAPSGEIYWAKSPEHITDKMALLTGSSSIYMSLKCAIAIAKQLNKPMPAWEEALTKLGEAIKYRPHLFNVTKSRFSMDWFYPVLSGALTGDAAKKQIDKNWKKFVVNGMGVKCVSDEPWITIAETSEFVLALAAMGNLRLAGIVFSWIQNKCFDDGSCWCGFTYPDMIIWPEDKVTWTNAVALMAADTLYNLTPASRLFSHQFWQESEFSCFV